MKHKRTLRLIAALMLYIGVVKWVVGPETLDMYDRVVVVLSGIGWMGIAVIMIYIIHES